jgi:protein-disulfide isomerase
LGQHKTAFAASTAAVCAAQQGKFGGMHNWLFTAQDHGDASLAGAAAALGLDAGAFRGCMASDEAHAEVLHDIAEAKTNGIEATPSLFPNGEPLALPDGKPDALREAVRSSLNGQKVPVSAREATLAEPGTVGRIRQ